MQRDSGYKIDVEWERSGGAGPASPRAVLCARGLAFLIVVRLCRRWMKAACWGEGMREAGLLLGDTATSKVTQSDSLPPTAFFRAIQIRMGKAQLAAELAEVAWSSSKERIELDFGVVGPQLGRKLPSRRVLQTACSASTLLRAVLGTAEKCQALPSISATASQGLS